MSACQRWCYFANAIREIAAETFNIFDMFNDDSSNTLSNHSDVVEMVGFQYRLRSSCRSSQPNPSCGEQSIEKSIAEIDRLSSHALDTGIASQLTTLLSVLEQHVVTPLHQDA